MKLATHKNGARDGRLMIVSRDLSHAVLPLEIGTLIEAVQNWRECAPVLQKQYDLLNAGRAPKSFELDTRRLAAPLPRAPQWLDASAFHSHGALMRQVFGTPPLEGERQLPLMYQGASDDFLGPCDDMPFPSETDGIDFEAELGVIVDFVPMGTPAARALAHIKLLVLLNDASLRAIAAREIRSGFGFLQSKPATSFAPVAVTVDELGDAWHGGRVHLPVRVHWNGHEFGHPDAAEMGFGFDDLIAHAAATRNLHAGSIIGCGTISNADFRVVGSACIAERRGMETVDQGKAATRYMKFGDTVRIEMRDRAQQSIFGAIDQRVVEALLPVA